MSLKTSLISLHTFSWRYPFKPVPPLFWARNIYLNLSLPTRCSFISLAGKARFAVYSICAEAEAISVVTHLPWPAIFNLHMAKVTEYVLTHNGGGGEGVWNDALVAHKNRVYARAAVVERTGYHQELFVICSAGTRRKNANSSWLTLSTVRKPSNLFTTSVTQRARIFQGSFDQ